MRWSKLVSLLIWASVGMALTAPALADTVYVTGNPARAAYLKEILGERGWKGAPPGDLGQGETWTSSQGDRLINLDWSPPPTSVVALSDHPEEIDRRGLLLSGGLTALRPVRLQYYHLGSLPGPSPGAWLELSNTGRESARVHLTRASGIPSKDYFSTGHGNNVAWLEADSRGEGEFLDIAPGETKTVFRQSLPEGYVVSGTLGITLVEGPPLLFGFLAAPNVEETASFVNLLKEKDVHSRGFYPVAVAEIRRRHVVGQAETRIAVGALRQETFSGVRELRGEYGVLYKLRVDLVNDGTEARAVDLIFNPRGGAATATFTLDGKLLEMPLSQAFAEAPMTSVVVPPRSQRSVFLQTVPEGASSYPIRIVVRDAVR